jgi:magnesium transporter
MSLVKSIGNKKVNFDFNKNFITIFSDKINNSDLQFINQTLKELHPSDVANLIENLAYETRVKLIEIESFNIAPEIFIELNESIQGEVLQLLSIDSFSNIIKRLESDDAVAILENLDLDKKNLILEKLPPKDRFLLEEGLSYPEDSAARIMQREFTAIPSDWTVGQTIDYLRESKDLPQEFLEIFIVDNDFKPIGIVPSSRVLRTSRDSKMNSIMREMPVLISVNMDKEEVGHTFENYNLVSAGVVNKNNKLVGMITADDVVTVVQEEAEEDVLRLAGVGNEEITDTVFVKTRRRFNWLLVNLATALLASWVISIFGAEIEKVVALAFLMPIVASMGGNAGMQTLAVTIRAIATKELSSSNINNFCNYYGYNSSVMV